MNSRIIPIFAFVIAATVFFVYVQPTWTGPIATTRAALAADNAALDAARQYDVRENQLASERDAISPESLKALAAFLPSSVDNVSLILDLNALATRSGLSISNIDVVKQDNAASGRSIAASAARGPDMGPVSSADLTLSAVGPFSALQTFLHGVEKSTRLLDVRALDVKGSDTGVYTYTMTLSFYWLR